MQLRKHLDAIPARIRVIISGTPIQNNLQEMHTLFDFACPVSGCSKQGVSSLMLGRLWKNPCECALG